MSTGTSFVDSIVRTKNVFVDVDGKNCNDKSSSRRRRSSRSRRFTSPYYFYILVLVLMMIMSLSYNNTIIRIIFFGDDNDEVGSYESQPSVVSLLAMTRIIRNSEECQFYYHIKSTFKLNFKNLYMKINIHQQQDVVLVGY